MKINVKKSKKILKIYGLKTKFYENFTDSVNISDPFFFDQKLLAFIVAFKQSLQLIYQYHFLKKNILFIGFPNKFSQIIRKKTTHSVQSYTFQPQQKENINISSLVVLFNHSNPKTLIEFFGKKNIIVVNYSPIFVSGSTVYSCNIANSSLQSLGFNNLIWSGLNFLFSSNLLKRKSSSLNLKRPRFSNRSHYKKGYQSRGQQKTFRQSFQKTSRKFN